MSSAGSWVGRRAAPAATTATTTATATTTTATTATATTPNYLLCSILSLVLEASPVLPSTRAYYSRLAERVKDDDPATVDLVLELAARVSGRYRSAREHALFASLVPMTKSPGPRAHSALDGDCAICLKPLLSHLRLVRVRPVHGDPSRCAHFFHADCFAHFELSQYGVAKACPMCRADLGVAVGTWEDLESDRPRF